MIWLILMGVILLKKEVWLSKFVLSDDHFLVQNCILKLLIFLSSNLK